MQGKCLVQIFVIFVLIVFGWQVMERACRLLSQLPANAPDILDALPFSIKSLQEYCHDAVETEVMSATTQPDHLKQLRVVHYVDDYILRYALHVAVMVLEAEDRKHGFDGGRVTDLILVLLRLSLQMSTEGGMQDAKWLIVCTFLWTLWQRSLMIHLWSSMAWQLRGFDYSSSSNLDRKGITLLPEIYMSRSRKQVEELGHTPYLCGWAFRSLRNDRANLAMDLRYFCALYHTQFGERPLTCNRGPTQCDGNHHKIVSGSRTQGHQERGINQCTTMSVKDLAKAYSGVENRSSAFRELRPLILPPQTLIIYDTVKSARARSLYLMFGVMAKGADRTM